MLTLTKVRVIYQIFFMALFIFFMVVTNLAFMKGYPVSWFLELDPLVGLATTIATGSLYKGLAWGLLLVLITTLFGRVFCNWICPLGILHHFFGWILDGRNTRQKIDSNRFHRWYNLKYYLLVLLLVMAAFRTLQIGWLDPIPFLTRSFTAAVLPAWDLLVDGMIRILPPAEPVLGKLHTSVEPRVAHWGFLIGAIFVLFLVLNRVIPRFWCRVLCPLGALLGVLSKFSLWQIHREPGKCTDCDLCLVSCQGASDPHSLLRKSECFVCMSCVDDCPYDAISYKFLPRLSSERPSPSLNRRRLLESGVFAALFMLFARSGGRDENRSVRNIIRPPGSVDEPEFLERCIKCDECIKVCPTNVLQPALFEAGVEGIWTPIMVNKVGYCELNCTLCGQVCPTGAIQRISIAQKLGTGEWEGRPVKTGTAFYDYGRCLPWSMDIPCVVCEEVCPTSPKAIYTKPVEITRRDGGITTLNRPYVDPQLCIGCGICEHECPVHDQRAIYVTSVGETRSKSNQLLLKG